ncbi:Nad3p (mitochondrion) [[Candida] subhashii]|jgi:NADH:ubiquinone oxidoreductase subunit 3 (subunit A)|uniref:NADH-ubiquinone oxidoreductase chain 3 n=1 Tax=[Candida] subhashii TaxID=561895 RepID=D8WJ07_9ASCO|nr:Nad3p [[Candida] subhashii]ACY66201.1 Nad3p [[Candida] subhashii]APC61690.1 Nad3p [[Candida] subhashii]
MTIRGTDPTEHLVSLPYIILMPVVALALVGINLLIATSNGYTEKAQPFECGFISFLQSRAAYSVGFILIAILFLPFDLEISSILPYTLASASSSVYGLSTLIAFLTLLVMAFIFEIRLSVIRLTRFYQRAAETETD